MLEFISHSKLVQKTSYRAQADHSANITNLMFHTINSVITYAWDADTYYLHLGERWVAMDT
jgi:hypothetical protein